MCTEPFSACACNDIEFMLNYSATLALSKMRLCSQRKMVCFMMFTLCIASTLAQEQREPLAVLSSLVIPATAGECPSSESRQAAHNFLRNATRDIIQNIAFDRVSEVCGPGVWRRVFYLNASQSGKSCPGQWNLVTSPVRSCGGASASCRSAFSDDINTGYSKVCGRIIGEATRTPDAFYSSLANPFEGNYMYIDGVSVTHGAAGSRTHIWSFGAGHPAGGGLVARCPCDSSNRLDAPLPPAEVGENYFCDRADELDPLWTGENCTSDSPCCSFHNPPYFSVQLPAVTTDRIELRICLDQTLDDESVVVLFAEIYVQ